MVAISALILVTLYGTTLGLPLLQGDKASRGWQQYCFPLLQGLVKSLAWVSVILRTKLTKITEVANWLSATLCASTSRWLDYGVPAGVDHPSDYQCYCLWPHTNESEIGWNPYFQLCSGPEGSALRKIQMSINYQNYQYNFWWAHETFSPLVAKLVYRSVEVLIQKTYSNWQNNETLNPQNYDMWTKNPCRNIRREPTCH